jgi:hypothetical protein
MARKLALVLCVFASAAVFAADLTPPTAAAFDRYAAHRAAHRRGSDARQGLL